MILEIYKKNRLEASRFVEKKNDTSTMLLRKNIPNITRRLQEKMGKKEKKEL